MEKEVLSFIDENSLKPFSDERFSVRSGGKSIFKTREGRDVYNKLISKISKNFVFSHTSQMLNMFGFCFENISSHISIIG